ncbi:MAG: hypothetical protein N2422_03325 [Rhodobacteraceae bacterium]|nr:hypothetical protein [Paracoccaceae bacterium]
MKRASTAPVLVWLAVILGLFGGVSLLKGGFYLGKHEGDTLHLAELVLRMAGGEWPHLDFMTPIGVLAIAPIAWFVGQGAGLGHAIFYAQLAVGLILLPAVLRVAVSRFGGLWSYAYGAFVMILCVALVHGESQSATSISMHYNRWAWAIAYVVVPLAVLAPLGRARPWLDGALIGLGMAALVLTKVTYFVALAPGVLIVLLARRNWSMLAAAVLAGLAVAAAMTLAAGPAFWLAYLGDLRTVAGSDIRAQPGEGFGQVVAAPPYMGASLTLVAAVILLRQAGRSVEGMALLFLMPGFFYIAFQNFGNDPQWLLLLAFMVFALLPAPGTRSGGGRDLRDGLRITGVLALAFAAPSAINLAYSPFRHLAAETDKTLPLLPGPVGRDIFTGQSRLYRVDFLRSGDGPDTPFAAYRERGEREYEAVLNGEVLPECVLESGMNAWFEVVARDLEANGYKGRAILGTDLFSLYWAFGDFRPVRGSAPWYYGGLSGVENADFVVVPLCPMAAQIRAGMLKSFAAEGWTLTEVRRTDLYVLVTAKRPDSQR